MIGQDNSLGITDTHGDRVFHIGADGLILFGIFMIIFRTLLNLRGQTEDIRGKGKDFLLHALFFEEILLEES